MEGIADDDGQPINLEILPGYQVQDDEKFYRPVFQARDIDPNLFTPTLQQYLAYSPELSPIEQERVKRARAELAHKNPKRVGNRRAGALNYIGRCLKKDIRPCKRVVQNINDNYFLRKNIKRRKTRGSPFDQATHNVAVAVTRELVALADACDTHRLVHLCIEWDWKIVNGRFGKNSKRRAFRRFNEQTQGDTDLHRNYRKPENHKEHGGILWYAAQEIKHQLSAKGLPAHGIVCIEESNIGKEGHIELLLILDLTFPMRGLADALKPILKKFGLRFKARDAYGAAGSSLTVLDKDFDAVFMAVLYLFKYQPSHNKVFNTSRKTLFRFRAKKALPMTALGPALIQVPGWTSQFLIPCDAHSDKYMPNKFGWGYPRLVDADGNDLPVTVVQQPELCDLV